MSSEPKPSQQISISGGTISGLQIGGQAGRDLDVNQSQQFSPDNSEQSLTPADVATLLEQLATVLQESDLPAEAKEKAVRSIATAKDEVQADEPDKEFAAKSLQRATKVLKDAGETVDAGTNLWQKVTPILEAITPWLGVATGFLV